MVSKTQQFIEKTLLTAEYEFDDEVKEWAGWISELPGIYAQKKTLEETRKKLAEILEEYLLINLRERKTIKGFSFNFRAADKIYSNA